MWYIQLMAAVCILIMVTGGIAKYGNLTDWFVFKQELALFRTEVANVRLLDKYVNSSEEQERNKEYSADQKDFLYMEKAGEGYGIKTVKGELYYVHKFPKLMRVKDNGKYLFYRLTENEGYSPRTYEFSYKTYRATLTVNRLGRMDLKTAKEIVEK